MTLRRLRALVLAAFICTLAQPVPVGSAQSTSVPAGTTQRDAEKHPVMLVVDTSGSMNDNDGTGRRKIDGARSALIDFTRALPPATPFGLRTYPGGTNSDAGCSTGLLRVPIAPPDLSAVDALIRSLQADGGTPTAAALKQAAEDIRARGNKAATIVLISDGLSNCGPDPCQVTRDVVASGIAVTVNTVGFQLSNEGRAQLQCIANAAHGRYQDVDNAAELVDELNRLARSLLEVRLNYPQSVKAVTGENGTGLVNVVAEITAVGVQAARDVQATLTFTVDGAPAVLSPRRRLGNLVSGGVGTVTWQFRPPLEDVPRVLTFQVGARGANSPPAVVKGSITLDPVYSLADAGPLLRDKKRIAILGDSYSAGEGGEAYLPGTDTDTNGCHRSPNTYAVTLLGGLRSQDPEAVAAGLARPDGTVDLFACSGGLARDLLLPNAENAGELAQIDHLYREPYDLALLSIGGNDIGYADIIIRCILAAVSCADSDAWQLIAGETLRAQVYEDIRGLTATLIDTLRAVEQALNSGGNLRERGKPAPLLVLAYPSQVPLGAGANSKLCSLEFDHTELAFFQELSIRLNAAVGAAVRHISAEGRPVYFVSNVIDAFQPDHTYCGREPWIHKVGVTGIVGALNDNANKRAQAATGTNRPFWQVLLTQGAVVAIAGRAVGTLEKPAAVRHYKEQMHPTKKGYQAMTTMLARWSTSPAALVPVTRTAPPGLEVAPPTPTPDIRVSGGPGAQNGTLEVRPGTTMTLRAPGFERNSSAELRIQSVPRVLGRVTTDAQGVAQFIVAIPPSMRVGAHELTLWGTGRDGELLVFTRPVRVTRSSMWWVPILGLAGVLLLVGGSPLLLRRRRMGSASSPSPDVLYDG